MINELKFKGEDPHTKLKLESITIQELATKGLSQKTADRIVYQRFTGFTDCYGNEIYEVDELGDWNVVDNEKQLSRQRVFWNQKTGSWHLGLSYDQDQTYSNELWKELNDFKYQILNPQL